MSGHAFAQQTLAPLLLTLALAAAWPNPAAADCTAPPRPAHLAPATVERVSDGDTVVLRLPDGRRERTLLLGIDAPESRETQKLERDATRTAQDRVTIQALGRQATAFTERHLPPDTMVGVEQDAQPRDRYRRILAYLWLADGSMVNVTIVREGYAQPFTKSPNVRYAALFRRCGTGRGGELSGLAGARRSAADTGRLGAPAPTP